MLMGSHDSRWEVFDAGEWMMEVSRVEDNGVDGVDEAVDADADADVDACALRANGTAIPAGCGVGGVLCGHCGKYRVVFGGIKLGVEL